VLLASSSRSSCLPFNRLDEHHWGNGQDLAFRIAQRDISEYFCRHVSCVFRTYGTLNALREACFTLLLK